MRHDTAFNVTQILRAAEVLHGVPVSDIVQRARVPISFVSNPLRPLPIALGSRLTEAAVTLTGDPLLGLKAGRMTHLRRSFGIAGVFLTHAPRVREGLERSVHVQNRTGNVLRGSLEDHGKETSLRVYRTVKGGLYCEQAMDFHVGVGVTSSQLYSDPRSMPYCVEVPAERLEKIGSAPYEAILGCAVVPTSGHAGLRFRSESLALGLPVDADVFEALEPAVARELSGLPQVYGLREAVGSVIEHGLTEAQACPDLNATARFLAMSPRTLQERLRQEETSMRQLLDEVRSRLANQLLSQGVSREETSARLGFSDSAAFRRAWQRWQRCGLSDR